MTRSILGFGNLIFNGNATHAGTTSDVGKLTLNGTHTGPISCPATFAPAFAGMGTNLGTTSLGGPVFPGDTNVFGTVTLHGLTLVYAAAELPLTIYLLRAFYIQIPTDIEDAARLDGCSDWRMFWAVMFPISRPAIVAVVILNFIGHWNEFLYAVVFISREELRTLPLAINNFLGENFQDIGMLATGRLR